MKLILKELSSGLSEVPHFEAMDFEFTSKYYEV